MPFDLQSGQWTDTPNYNYNWYSGPPPGAAQNPGLAPTPQTPQQPTLPGPNQGFQPNPDFTGGQDNNPVRTTMPVQNPDIFGVGQQQSPAFNFGGAAATLPYTPHTPPTFTPTTGPAPAASTLPQPTPSQAATGVAQQGQYDVGQAKYDPAYLAQVQAALESQNGPYAGRQAGDYAPSTAPLGVQNPQTQKDWVDRYYWFAAHPEALANPTAPRQTSAGNRDYTMPFTTPYGEFQKNLYADSNAQQSFKELQGVLTPQQLAQVRQVYGWQEAAPATALDQNAAERAGIAMATADPNSDYSIIQVAQPNGSVTYGIEKRSRVSAAPQAPVVHAASGGGGRPTYGGTGSGGARPALPAPTPPAPRVLNSNPPGLGQANMNQPVEGQIVQYGNQYVQFRQGQWVPYAYNGGGAQSPSPI